MWCPDEDSPRNVKPSTHFTRACIFISSNVAFLVTDYACVTFLAMEGDLRHAEARHQETRGESYAKTLWMLQ
ncbi:hypothetical protein B2J95_23540 [Enterobacter cloacae]|nr:hypothetical protein B2J95_23540 [Enterobacter cloacae]EBW8988658.1 hypothetical protein [Salmonella enterica subsp. enterica serovar Enteritidis]PPV37660.1 hypothetical protein C4L14_11090 [Enterobacter sp. RC4]KAA3571649.1 hypothetical protein D1176_19670 [Enterobacter cloacae]KAA3574110.1 hypothetical protein D1177_19240 [Enterobacter cloacae]